MLFNSPAFLIFFPLVTAGYFLLPARFRNPFLLAASCYFYMSYIPIYILILVYTILVDYVAGLRIESSVGGKRKAWLALSLFANIGALVLFKYATLIAQAWGLFGLAPGFLTRIVLPIGLSFHTFQAMSYTLEVYKGRQAAERNLLTYSLYVMFFPQMVAGPIERPQNLLHQFREDHRFRYDETVKGLRRILLGMFKKVVVADHLTRAVDFVYGNPGTTPAGYWSSPPSSSPFRSTVTSRGIRTSPSGPRRSWGSVSWSTSEIPTGPTASATCGSAGTFPFRVGFGITCTFPWAEAVRAREFFISTSSSPSSSAASGTGPT